METGLRQLVRASLLGLALSIASMQVFERVIADPSSRDFGNWLEVISVLRLAVVAMLAAGVLRLRARAPVAGAVALTALAADFAVQAAYVGWSLYALDDGGARQPEIFHDVLPWVGRAASLAADVALAWLVGAVAASPRLRGAARVVAALSVAPYLLASFADARWLPRLVGFAATLALAGVALAVLWRAPSPSPAARAAAGLRTYRDGILARLALFLGGLAVTFAAARWLERPELARFVTVLLPAVTLLPGVVMAEGLLRFARFRDAGTAARLAIVLLVAGLAADAWAAALTGDMIFGRHIDMNAVRRMQWLGLAGTLLALATLAAALAAFARVARALDRLEMIPRVRVQAALMFGVALGAAGVSALANTRGMPPPALALFAVGVLVVALVALVRYLGLVADLARDLDHAG